MDFTGKSGPDHGWRRWNWPCHRIGFRGARRAKVMVVDSDVAAGRASAPMPSRKRAAPRNLLRLT